MPMTVVGGASSVIGSWLGNSGGRTGRATVGMMFVLDGAEEACARSTRSGGFGGRGVNTGGAGSRNTSRSGCSVGMTTSVAAIAH